MAKVKIPLTAYAFETSNVLSKRGCLLVSGTIEKTNVMTIGWGLIGMLWGRSVFMVAVRPSRHTFKLMEEIDEFTVNVPVKGMEDLVEYCGSVSGRNENKFEKKGLTKTEAEKVNTPIISECAIHYECKLMFKTKITPEEIPEDESQRWYPKGDYHTIYFGEILCTTADEDAASRLAE